MIWKKLQKSTKRFIYWLAIPNAVISFGLGIFYALIDIYEGEQLMVYFLLMSLMCIYDIIVFIVFVLFSLFKKVDRSLRHFVGLFFLFIFFLIISYILPFICTLLFRIIIWGPGLLWKKFM